MGEDLNQGRQIQLELKIARAMEELRQLHLKPTSDDFQNFWRKKLEASLLSLRQEMREFGAEDRNKVVVSAIAVA
jgi:hypothetical protein